MNDTNFELNCPIPINEYDRVLLAHGGGGKLTHRLIGKMFFETFKNPLLDKAHDGAVFEIENNKLAFTTDSFVIDPIFFPGGNIGELAVNGTINDLVCCGAKPMYLSLAFIIEEGLLMSDLWKIVQSIKLAADKASVDIITGDTKVVEKGKGDKIFINTTGIGSVIDGLDITPENCRLGDVIIVNGDIADHGIAIMSSRKGLEFETTIESDTVALNGLFQTIYNVCPDIHLMRDPTRGGLSSTLNEIAKSAQLGIELYEEKIPIKEEVKGACEILGFDPLYIANEGKILFFVPEKHKNTVLSAMRKHPYGKKAASIGKVVEQHKGMVTLKTTIGSTRIVDMISGEQLPRIC